MIDRLLKIILELTNKLRFTFFTVNVDRQKGKNAPSSTAIWERSAKQETIKHVINEDLKIVWSKMAVLCLSNGIVV